jgi:hypothetical protein
MSERPSRSDNDGDRRRRWPRTALIVIAVVALVVLAVVVMGVRGHGPGRHMLPAVGATTGRLA